MLDIIVSQGRVADRSDRTIIGARLAAAAIASRFDGTTHTVGSPSEPAEDDWSISLPQARATLVDLKAALMENISEGKFALLVTNTCPASLATLPVVATCYPEATILWVDAHGDFNTPQTTGTGYLGGMVVSAACGLWNSGHGAGLNPKQVVLLGARDIDDKESELLTRSGVRIIPPAQATPEAVLATLGGAPIWIHIDWDSLEPGFVPADYAVPAGLLPDQLRRIFEAIPADQCLGLEIAEFHPSDSDAENHAAIATIIHIIEPLLEAQHVNDGSIGHQVESA
ncbi:arginase family protein [Sphingobium sp. H39-3-25]|uniref:arginase family protein n=1 Tax=Sphingobium arseniciresistens TaxID=3030834 RepID=UPI0023BA1E69|nr:arginase family protein [Sphingobium arseniciresistens]